MAASGEQMKKDRRARVQTPERRGRGGIRCQSSLVGGEEEFLLSVPALIIGRREAAPWPRIQHRPR